MPDRPSGAFLALPPGSRLYGYTLTGRTPGGDPVAVTGTVTAADREAAGRQVEEGLATARRQPGSAGRWPGPDARLTVFEVQLGPMADVLMANGYRVQPPVVAGEVIGRV